jgi:hypothetical protein
MTQFKKWYASMAFWTKMKMFVGAFGAGGTVTLVITDVAEWLPWITGIATVIGVAISVFFEDKNNDGIVDAFEKKYRNHTKK